MKIIFFQILICFLTYGCSSRNNIPVHSNENQRNNLLILLTEDNPGYKYVDLSLKFINPLRSYEFEASINEQFGLVLPVGKYMGFLTISSGVKKLNYQIVFEDKSHHKNFEKDLCVPRYLQESKMCGRFIKSFSCPMLTLNKKNKTLLSIKITNKFNRCFALLGEYIQNEILVDIYNE